MKRLLSILFVPLLLCGQARAITLTNAGTNYAYSSATTVTVTVSTDVAIGSVIIVGIEDFSGTIGSSYVSDTQSNSYVLAASQLSNDGAKTQLFYYCWSSCKALASGVDSITYHSSSAGTSLIGTVAFCGSGLLTSSNPIDIAVSAKGYGTTPSVTTGTALTSGELFVGITSRDVATDPWAQAAGWANEPAGDVPGYMFGGNLTNAGTGAETYDPTFSVGAVSGNWNISVVSFLPADYTPPASSGCTRMLQGAGPC